MGHNVTEYLRQSGSKDKKSRQRKRTAVKVAVPVFLAAVETD